jgi:hypothetical protein
MLGVVGVGVAVFLITQRTNTISTQVSEEISQTLRERVRRQTTSTGKAEAQKILEDVQKQLDQAGIPGVQLGSGSTQAQLSLLTSAGIKQALEEYKAALGVKQLAVKRLTFHDTHSSLEAQSPKNPNHIDRYMYRAGSVGAPVPQRLSSSEKKNLKAVLFDPDQTALNDMDTLKTTTLGKLAYENAEISHVIVERRRGKTEILVYGSSPRDSGYVRFSDDGKVVRVYR